MVCIGYHKVVLRVLRRDVKDGLPITQVTLVSEAELCFDPLGVLCCVLTKLCMHVRTLSNKGVMGCIEHRSRGVFNVYFVIV